MKRWLILVAVVVGLLGVGGAVLYFTVLRTTEPKELTREEIKQKEFNELKAMLEEHIPELEKSIEPALLEEFKKQDPSVRTRVRDTIEFKNHQLMNDKQRYRFIDARGISYVGDENSISIFAKLLWRKINNLPFDVDAVIAEYDKVVELWRAVDNNDIEAARKLVTEGVSPNRNMRSSSDETIFSKALARGNAQMIDLLVKGMRNPNEKTNYGMTPLLYATGRNNTEVAHILLEKGADPNSTDESRGGATAIFSAVEHGNIELVRLLLENGADVNQERDSGYTVLADLNISCPKSRRENKDNICNNEIRKMLLDKGAKVFPKYFPEKSLRDSMNNWFSSALRAVREEPLMKERVHETYRFAWLRSFHPQVVVRLQDMGKEKRITVKIQTGRDERTRMQFTEKTRTLPEDTWRQLKTLVDESKFRKMPTTFQRKSPEGHEIVGLDGAEWILEAAGKEPYKLVVRWTPEDGDPLKKLCLYILSLSGEKFDPIY